MSDLLWASTLFFLKMQSHLPQQLPVLLGDPRGISFGAVCSYTHMHGVHCICSYVSWENFSVTTLENSRNFSSQRHSITKFLALGKQVYLIERVWALAFCLPFPSWFPIWKTGWFLLLCVTRRPLFHFVQMYRLSWQTASVQHLPGKYSQTSDFTLLHLSVLIFKTRQQS